MSTKNDETLDCLSELIRTNYEPVRPKRNLIATSYHLPLIGLEYIVEFRDVSNEKHEGYYCVLCEYDVDSLYLLGHVTSLYHQTKYMFKFFPSVQKMFTSNVKFSTWSKDVIKVFDKIVEITANKFGRMDRLIKQKDDFYSEKSHVRRQLELGLHFVESKSFNFLSVPSPLTESALVSLESLKTMETLQTSNVSENNSEIIPEDLETVKHSNQASDSSSKKKKNYGNRNYRSQDRSLFLEGMVVKDEVTCDDDLTFNQEDDIQIVSENVNSGSEHRHKTTETKEDDNNSGRCLDRRVKKNKTRSRSPHTRDFKPDNFHDRHRGGRLHSSFDNYSPQSTRRLKRSEDGETGSHPKHSRSRNTQTAKQGNAEDASPSVPEMSNMDKYQMLLSELRRLGSDQFEKWLAFINQPETHPAYPEEWKKYWKAKYTLLTERGEDTKNYDFKADWVVFWDDFLMGSIKKEIEAVKVMRFNNAHLEKIIDDNVSLRFVKTNKNDKASRGEEHRSSVEKSKHSGRHGNSRGVAHSRASNAYTGKSREDASLYKTENRFGNRSIPLGNPVTNASHHDGGHGRTEITEWSRRESSMERRDNHEGNDRVDRRFSINGRRNCMTSPRRRNRSCEGSPPAKRISREMSPSGRHVTQERSPRRHVMREVPRQRSREFSPRRLQRHSGEASEREDYLRGSSPRRRFVSRDSFASSPRRSRHPPPSGCSANDRTVCRNPVDERSRNSSIEKYGYSLKGFRDTLGISVEENQQKYRSPRCSSPELTRTYQSQNVKVDERSFGDSRQRGGHLQRGESTEVPYRTNVRDLPRSTSEVVYRDVVAQTKRGLSLLSREEIAHTLEASLENTKRNLEHKVASNHFASNMDVDQRNELTGNMGMPYLSSMNQEEVLSHQAQHVNPDASEDRKSLDRPDGHPKTWSQDARHDNTRVIGKDVTNPWEYQRIISAGAKPGLTITIENFRNPTPPREPQELPLDQPVSFYFFLKYLHENFGNDLKFLSDRIRVIYIRASNLEQQQVGTSMCLLRESSCRDVVMDIGYRLTELGQSCSEKGPVPHKIRWALAQLRSFLAKTGEISRQTSSGNNYQAPVSEQRNIGVMENQLYPRDENVRLENEVGHSRSTGQPLPSSGVDGDRTYRTICPEPAENEGVRRQNVGVAATAYQWKSDAPNSTVYTEIPNRPNSYAESNDDFPRQNMVQTRPLNEPPNRRILRLQDINYAFLDSREPQVALNLNSLTVMLQNFNSLPFAIQTKLLVYLKKAEVTKVDELRQLRVAIHGQQQAGSSNDIPPMEEPPVRKTNVPPPQDVRFGYPDDSGRYPPVGYPSPMFPNQRNVRAEPRFYR